MLDLQIEIFLLLLIGFLLSKIGLLNKDARKVITDLVLYLILPCATAKSFLMELTPELIRNTLTVFLISVCLHGGIAFSFRYLYKGINEDKAVNLRYATLVSNAGFMGMPVAEGLFGSTGLLYAAIYLIPLRVLMWSYGLSQYTVASKETLIKKVLLHPCIVALYIGILLMTLTSLGVTFPVFFTNTLSALASGNTALSMIVIGGILSEVHPKELLDRLSLFYSLIRLILIPVCLYLILLILPIDSTTRSLSVVLAAMPAASTTGMLANKYDRDPEFASRLIFVSTLCSLITLPILTLLIV